MTDLITETDLHAFIDGQLEVARRIEVEDYLAGQPEIAVRVMADMQARDALALAFSSGPATRPPERVMEAARQLERGLVWRRVGLRLQRAAAVAFLVGAGWFAHAQVGLFEITDSEASPKPPAFVEDARHSHETTLIRARMVSQHERPHYDPTEIRAETGIAMPTLPTDWRVVDAQVFPSRFGHSIEIALEADALGRVSLFAARSPSFGVIPLTLTRSATDTTAFWKSGDLVYARTDAAQEPAIERAAASLNASLP